MYGCPGTGEQLAAITFNPDRNLATKTVSCANRVWVMVPHTTDEPTGPGAGRFSRDNASGHAEPADCSSCDFVSGADSAHARPEWPAELRPRRAETRVRPAHTTWTWCG